MGDDDKIPPLARPYKIDLTSEPAPRTAPPPPKESLFKRSPATPLIVGLNTLVFLLMCLTSGGQAFTNPDNRTLLEWGGNYGPLTLNGEFWRAFTCMFVHIGAIHYVMNMYVLWDVGIALERLFGTSKFLVIYVLAGLGGSIASLFFTPTIPSAGASGAVFGAYGGLLAIFQGHRKSFNPEGLKSATRAVVFLLLFNLIWGFSKPNIDNAAHIGGFITGGLAGFALLSKDLEERRWSTQNVAWTLLLVIVLGAGGYFDYLSFGNQNR